MKFFVKMRVYLLLFGFVALMSFTSKAQAPCTQILGICPQISGDYPCAFIYYNVALESTCYQCVSYGQGTFEVVAGGGFNIQNDAGQSYTQNLAGTYLIPSYLVDFVGGTIPKIKIMFLNGNSPYSINWYPPNSAPPGSGCYFPNLTRSYFTNCDCTPGGGTGQNCGFENMYGNNLSNSIVEVDYDFSLDSYFTLGTNGSGAMFFSKMDATGSVIYNKSIGNSFVPKSMIKLSSGEYYVAADSVNLSNQNKGAIYLFRIDAVDGSVLWTLRFDSDTRDRNPQLIRSTSTEYFLIFNKKGSSWGDDLVVCKIDENGNKLWDKSYHDPSDAFYASRYNDFIADNNGGFTTVGECRDYLNDTTSRVGFIMRVASDGTVLDRVRHQQPGQSNPNGNHGYFKIRKLSTGDYVVVGDRQAFVGIGGAQADRDVIVRKLPSNNLLSSYWEANVDFNSVGNTSGPWNAGIQSVSEGVNGNIYITLYKYGAPLDYKAKLLELSSNGDNVRTIRFGDLTNIRQIVSNSHYILYGTETFTNGYGSSDFYLSKQLNPGSFCKARQDTLVVAPYSEYYTPNGALVITNNVVNVAVHTNYVASNSSLSKGNLCNQSTSCSLTANFNYTGSPSIGSLLTFSNSSTDPLNNITQYSWNFGDGNTSSQENPTHAYGNNGSYAVTLAIKNDGCPSCYDTIQKVINIGVIGGDDCPLVANFTSKGKFCKNNPIEFIDASEPLNAGTYSWNFGDNTTSSLVGPAHTYSNPGVYLITLVVDGGNGCIDTVIKSVTIDSTCVMPCESCIGSFAPTPNKKYVFSAWAKEKVTPPAMPTTYTKPRVFIVLTNSAGTTSSMGPYMPKGIIVDGWQRIEEEFTIPLGTVNVQVKLETTSGESYFDDVRVFPSDGLMKSFVYDPITLRFVAEMDERNYATFYEYDEEGNLTRTKKETERGIVTIQENRSNLQKQ